MEILNFLANQFLNNLQHVETLSPIDISIHTCLLLSQNWLAIFCYGNLKLHQTI